jgi:glycosyltransferase involved in cell wall biosynthesis
LILVSLVIPLFNEEESLPELKAGLDAALERLGGSGEMIFVDDGSSDGSLDILRRFHAAEPQRVRVLAFRRNQGKSAALAAGFQEVRGEFVVTLDADFADLKGKARIAKGGHHAVTGVFVLGRGNAAVGHAIDARRGIVGVLTDQRVKVCTRAGLIKQLVGERFCLVLAAADRLAGHGLKFGNRGVLPEPCEIGRSGRRRTRRWRLTAVYCARCVRRANAVSCSTSPTAWAPSATRRRRERSSMASRRT